MIRKLRRKFVLLTMLSLMFVMVVVIGTINLLNYREINGKIDEILEVLVANGGEFPEENLEERPPKQPDHMEKPMGMTGETRFSTRYFTIRVKEAGEILSTDTSNIATISLDEAEKYGLSAIASKKQTGFLESYKFRKQNEAGESLLVFMDCSMQIDSIKSLLGLSVSIAGVCFFIMFILVTLFSKRAIRPVMESMEKQKRFITDAGHELKTPLAIISANAEVLELKHGKSEWLSSIRNQTARLDELVKGMLTLAKMEEGIHATAQQPFSVTAALNETIQLFETIAEKKGNKIEKQVEEGVTISGDETRIRQLFSILIDNATKYARENGLITITLKREKKYGKEVIQIQIYNELSKVPTGDLEKLFERFYREDSSRARESGGYGIGLSVARMIVEAHKGRLTAKARKQGICFEIEL